MCIRSVYHYFWILLSNFDFPGTLLFSSMFHYSFASSEEYFVEMKFDEGVSFTAVHTMTNNGIDCGANCLESVNCVGFRVLTEGICQHTTCINPYLYNHSNGVVSNEDAYIQKIFNVSKLLARGKLIFCIYQMTQIKDDVLHIP